MVDKKGSLCFSYVFKGTYSFYPFYWYKTKYNSVNLAVYVLIELDVNSWEKMLL